MIRVPYIITQNPHYVGTWTLRDYRSTMLGPLAGIPRDAASSHCYSGCTLESTGLWVLWQRFGCSVFRFWFLRAYRGCFLSFWFSCDCLETAGGINTATCSQCADTETGTVKLPSQTSFCKVCASAPQTCSSVRRRTHNYYVTTTPPPPSRKHDRHIRMPKQIFKILQKANSLCASLCLSWAGRSSKASFSFSGLLVRNLNSTPRIQKPYIFHYISIYSGNLN